MMSVAKQAQSQRSVSPLLAANLNDLILTTVVLGCRNNYSEDLFAVAQPGLPRHIRRAERAIYDDPGHPWTVAEIAAEAGVSIRSVQVGFRTHLGCSPFELLRSVRLTRAHDDLTHPEPTDTVTSIALRWGFSDMGRFATYYRHRYVSSPHETLRNAR